MTFSLSKNKGFTLIEAAIILIIFGIILGGIYLAFNTALKERRLADTRRQVADIVNGVRDYFSGQNINIGQTGAYTYNAGTFMQTMHSNAQVFPNDAGCTTGGATCRNPYNGNYALGLINSAGRYQLVVQATNLPREACINLAASIGGAPENQQQTGFVGFSTGATMGAPSTVPGTTGITPATATTLCTPPANSNVITLNMVFRL